jgi:hypothetical protein
MRKLQRIQVLQRKASIINELRVINSLPFHCFQLPLSQISGHNFSTESEIGEQREGL